MQRKTLGLRLWEVVAFTPLILFLSASAASQESYTPHRVHPIMLSYNVAPLFLEGNGFHSSVAIVNPIAKSEKMILTVRRDDGFVLAERNISIDPHSQQRYELSDLIGTPANQCVTGSVILFPTEEDGMTVAAQLSISYSKDQITSFIDEEFVMPGTHSSPVLRGVGSKSRGNPLIALVSLSSNNQVISIQCWTDDHSADHVYNVDLLRNKTLVVRACDERQPAKDAVSMLSATSGKTSKQHAVAISLRSNGTAGGFAAYGITAYSRDSTKNDRQKLEMVGMPFSDPGKLYSLNMIFAGVPVAVVDEHVRFVPSVTVSNFGSSPASLKIRFAPGSAKSDTSKPEIFDLVNAELKPNEVRSYEFNDLPSKVPIGSIVIESNGKIGDVLSSLTSFADATNSHLSIEGHDANAIENGGKHPWTIDKSPTSDAALILFNHSSATDRFTVHVTGDGTVWSKRYEIPSMQTLTVSLRQVIDKQLKDDYGHSLPPSLSSGAVTWYASKRGIGKGRLYETSSNPLKRRSFSCLGIISICGYGMTFQDSSNLALDIGETELLGPISAEECSTNDPNSGPCGDVDMGIQYNNFYAVWQGCSHATGCTTGSLYDPQQSINVTGQSYGVDNLTILLTDMSNYQCSAATFASVSVTACPSTSYIQSNTQIDPTYYGGQTPPIITAAGSQALMHVGDSTNSTDFMGQRITEVVSLIDSTCPWNPCVGMANDLNPFVVGRDDSGRVFSIYAPATWNAFWDFHETLSTHNLLGEANIGGCAARCLQTYKCLGSGTTMGAYTIYYHYAPGTVNGQPGTLVTVDKY
jgi:hypothetical protein